jgi:hypothetical protein
MLSVCLAARARRQRQTASRAAFEPESDERVASDAFPPAEALADVEVVAPLVVPPLEKLAAARFGELPASTTVVVTV